MGANMTEDYFTKRRLQIEQKTGKPADAVPARNGRINAAVERIAGVLDGNERLTERTLAYLEGRLGAAGDAASLPDSKVVIIVPSLSQMPNRGYEWRTNVNRRTVDLLRPDMLESRFNDYWSTCTSVAICFEAYAPEGQSLDHMYGIYVIPKRR